MTRTQDVATLISNSAFRPHAYKSTTFLAPCNN